MGPSAPRPLVDAATLEAQLGDPDLRVLDCTVRFEATPEGAVVSSGRPGYEAGHVPGAAFLDLMDELADPDAPYGFMLPPADRFAEALGRLGVGEGTRSSSTTRVAACRAARAWWNLRAYGFDDAAVLDGGWTTWTQEAGPSRRSRPATRRPPSSPARAPACSRRRTTSSRRSARARRAC
ncbi:MAG: rhodanese-like domain-containing protein [Thermoleophilia bacterium]